MTQKRSRSLVSILTVGIFILFAASGLTATPSNATPVASLRDAPMEEEVEPEAGVDEVEAVSAEAGTEENPASAQPTVPWDSYPNVCETFTVIEGTKRVRNKNTGKLQYPIRYKRNRYDRKRSDQRRTREIIRLVAREMGADEAGQYLVDMIAHHESSWNPEAIHILNRDLEANLDAWENFSYDAGREKQLEEKLRTTSAKTKEFWKIKAQLADLRLYKGNAYWNSQLEYVHQIPERTLHGETTKEIEVVERRSVWAYGYGLFGMNSVLYMHVFDKTAPPWVLCGDEGIVAVVTAIWALREQQADCEYLTGKNPDKYGTDGGSARGVIRRFARGHCGDGKLGPAWRRLMADSDYSKHIDYDKAPDLGHNFTKFEMHRRNGKWVYTYETKKDPKTGETLLDKRGRPVYKRDDNGRKVKIPADRQAILAHMRTKVEEKGLFREQPLERKKPGSTPIVVAGTGSLAGGAVAAP
jgi:hypothetical protein